MLPARQGEARSVPRGSRLRLTGDTGRLRSVVALGIDVTGQKHALGVWEGSTEHTTVCQGLLTNLQSRGLRTERSVLVILDGAKALHTAVTQTFGAAAVLQRCQIHTQRNVLEYLPQAQRPWVQAILTRAYTHRDVKAARRL